MASIGNSELKDMIIYSHISANMMDILSMEKYIIGLKKDFNTACWYFDFKEDSNVISIGDGVFERVKDGYTNHQKIIDSYLIHEAAHSIYTDKNLVALQAKLKEEKISFKLFNLFEDARIESKIRKEFGYYFNWTDFEDIPEDTPNESPTTTLFKIIQTEDKEYFDVPYFEKVKMFYDKIVNAKNSEEMINIIKEWLKDFPNANEPEHNKGMSQGQGQEQSQDGKDKDKDKDKGQGQSQGQEEEEKSDLEMAAELQGDDALAEEFRNGVDVVVGDAKQMSDELEAEIDRENKKDVKYLSPVEASGKTLEASNSSTIFADVPYRESGLYAEKLDDAEDKLKRILKTIGVENLNSSSPSKSFNIKGVVQALSGSVNAKPYKKSVEEDIDFDKKKVFIIMDGSGSMSGLPEKNMITFSVVVNRLANQGLMSGWICGSKVMGKAINQAMTLPVSDGQLTSFSADAQGEGIGYAIKAHIENINKADYVFVLTDGQITDRELDFIKRDYPDVYSKSIGVYMGDKRYANQKQLKEWFNHSVIESKFEDMVEKVVVMLDPSKKSAQILNDLEYDEKNKAYIEEQVNQILGR